MSWDAMTREVTRIGREYIERAQAENFRQAAELKKMEARISDFHRGHEALVAALIDCRNYLSGIPETAAGGDDHAVWLTQQANKALDMAGVQS